MLLGANWPFDRALDDERCWVIFDALQPSEVLITSHANAGDYDRLLGGPGLVFDIRMKTGWGNRGSWPQAGIDFKEWDSEQSTREACRRVLEAGHRCRLWRGNEPDIELAREPVDDAVNMEDAINSYIAWASMVATQIRNDPSLAGLEIVSTPLSQGAPGRFRRWWDGAILSTMDECSAVGEHCYTNGRPFDHPDWGGRFQQLQAIGGRPILLGEVNDNGAQPPGERAQTLADYVSWVESTGQVETLSMFTLPGGMADASKPDWWFLRESDAVAIANRAPFVPGDVASGGSWAIFQQQQ